MIIKAGLWLEEMALFIVYPVFITKIKAYSYKFLGKSEWDRQLLKVIFKWNNVECLQGLRTTIYTK